jgi:phage terminase Nu1 subunit (DNA packaging protein)
MSKRFETKSPPKAVWDAEQFITQSDLARVLGVTQQNISALTTAGVLERRGGSEGGDNGAGVGRYALGHNVRRWADYKIRNVIDDSERELRESRKRKLDAEAESAEIELAQKRGEMVELRLIKIFLEDFAVRIRNAFLIIPARLQRRIVRSDTKSILELMRLEIERVLNMLSEVKPHEIEDLLKKAYREEEEDLV